MLAGPAVDRGWGSDPSTGASRGTHRAAQRYLPCQLLQGKKVIAATSTWQAFALESTGYLRLDTAVQHIVM